MCSEHKIYSSTAVPITSGNTLGTWFMNKVPILYQYAFCHTSSGLDVYMVELVEGHRVRVSASSTLGPGHACSPTSPGPHVSRDSNLLRLFFGTEEKHRYFGHAAFSIFGRFVPSCRP